jgi:hypothetical protein
VDHNGIGPLGAVEVPIAGNVDDDGAELDNEDPQIVEEQTKVFVLG